MRFSSLGSGSRGNAILVEEGQTCVMVDCGFSLRETERRLAILGKQLADISAVLVTHEHSDHVRGINPFMKKTGIPVWMTQGTMDGCKLAAGLSVTVFDRDESIEINDLSIDPFPMPHDANEPCQFVFNNGEKRLGILTDVGSETPAIIDHLNACDALLLECNHDEDMLSGSEYPAFLKQRILGDYGHFSNEQAASLLQKLDCSDLQHIVALHLSEKNNETQLVRQALSDVLDCEQGWIGVAEQNIELQWRSIL